MAEGAVSASTEEVPPPPEGFVSDDLRGPFSTHNGPYFKRQTEAGTIRALYVLRRHCNSYGIVHGGMLASFLDGVLGHAVGTAARRPSVTIHLSLDYLSMARAGEWLMGAGKVNRLTRDVAFAEARAYVGERDVIRATAVFKLMESRPGKG